MGTDSAVIKSRGPGILPGNYEMAECGPGYFCLKLEDK